MSDSEQFQRIMNDHPALCDEGYDPLRVREDNEYHLMLANCVEEFVVAREWIAKNLLHSKRINPRRSSYGMKHVMERDIGIYVSEGSFIAAMLVNEFRMEAKSGYSPSFNVREISVRRIEKRISITGRAAVVKMVRQR